MISTIPLFGDMDSSEVDSLCGFMHCFGAPRDTTLIHEASEGAFLLIILTGRVHVIKNAHQADRTIAMVGPGESVGEMSMIDGEPRFASCITVEPTDVAVFTRQALNDLLLNMPRLGNKLLLVLLRLMTRRLRETSNSLLPHIAVTTV